MWQKHIVVVLRLEDWLSWSLNLVLESSINQLSEISRSMHTDMKALIIMHMIVKFDDSYKLLIREVKYIQLPNPRNIVVYNHNNWIYTYSLIYPKNTSYHSYIIKICHRKSISLLLSPPHDSPQISYEHSETNQERRTSIEASK